AAPVRAGRAPRVREPGSAALAGPKGGGTQWRQAASAVAPPKPTSSPPPKPRPPAPRKPGAKRPAAQQPAETKRKGCRGSAAAVLLLAAAGLTAILHRLFA